MKLRKILAALLSMIISIGLLAGCGGGNSPSPSTQAPATAPPSGSGTTTPAPSSNPATSEVKIDPITLKLAHGLAQNSMTGQQYNSFCEFVEQLSGGAMKIEQHVGGSLLSDTETLDAVMEGSIDFCHNMVSYASGVIPDLALLAVPGYYAGDNYLAFAAAVQQPLEAIYAKYDIKYLGSNYQGTTTFVCSKRLITKPDDLKGLSFRTSGTWLGKAMENWGASAITIPLGDLTTALERGTVDGTYTGWTITGPFALYEVAKYVTFTSITESFGNLLMSMDTWNSLTDAQKAIIEEAAKLYIEESYHIGYALRDEYYSAMEDAGTELYTLTAAEEKVFTDISLKLFDEIEPTLSPDGKALLAILK